MSSLSMRGSIRSAPFSSMYMHRKHKIYPSRLSIAMVEIFKKRILRIMQPPFLFHSNLLTRHAQKTAIKHHIQRISWNRGPCSPILASLHSGCLGMVGSGASDSMSNLQDAVHRISILHPLTAYQCFFHVSYHRVDITESSSSCLLLTSYFKYGTYKCYRPGF